MITAAQALGAAPLEKVLPAISLDNPTITDVVKSIVTNLPPEAPLYRFAEKFVTITVVTEKDAHGKPVRRIDVRDMTPERLCSWLEQYMTFRKTSKEKAIPTALNTQFATKILACDLFLSAAPPVREITNVRLPIPGSNPGEIDLLPVGYHAPTRTFTGETLRYDTTPATLDKLTPKTLRAIWRSLTSSFPWAPDDPNDTSPHALDPVHNRSACATLAFMLGQFARFQHKKNPMVIINANQPGTGKTLLAHFCLAPTWGIIPAVNKPKDDEELNKVLSAHVLEALPFCLLDDIPTLHSHAINAFATEEYHRGRLLHSNNSFTAKNTTQIVATGNGLTCTPDIERRSLIIDLWCETAATERVIKKPLQKEHLSEPSWRADLLTFLFALENNWAKAGCPLTTPGTAKPSFESYAQVIGSILTANGFGNPFRARPEDADGGDLIGRAVLNTLAITAGLMTTQTATFDLAHLTSVARENGYLETITRGKDAHTVMGIKLKPYRRRRLKDTKGRTFIFGRGHDAACTLYDFEILPD